MTARVRLSIFGAALLSAVGLAVGQWTPWASSASSACEQAPLVTAPAAHGKDRPIVLVHGWDGNAANMHPVGSYLTDKLHLPVQLFYFDYSSHNTDWADNPAVSGCLASYITTISKSYRDQGGDGKVIVIAHSMGGLAIRFAASSKFESDPVGADLAGVITIDTPSLGSPFGNTSLARALEAVPVAGGSKIKSLFSAPVGSDASICLAQHEPPANSMPSGCAVAPYLPAGVPITQLAGEMSIKRTLFGIHLYTVDLGTDGPVPTTSSHGYSSSGPGDVAPKGTEASNMPTVSCTVSFDEVAGIAAVQGALKNGATGAFAALGDVLTPDMFTDASALDSLQSGQTNSALLGFLLAAYAQAPCSHSGMLTDSESLGDVGSAVQQDLAHPGNPAAAAAPPPLTTASTCAQWDAASDPARQALAATVSPHVQLTSPVPTKPSIHEAFMVGFLAGGCDRAQKQGKTLSSVSLESVLNGDYTASTPTAPTTPPLASAFAPSATWTYRGRDKSGYKVTVRAQASKPVFARKAPLLPGFESRQQILRACSDFNPQTDAVVPVEIVVTNRTARFSADIDFQVDVQGVRDAGLPFGLSTIDYIGQNVQCVSTNFATAYSFSCKINPGSTCTVPAYIVIKNDFSPAKPYGHANWPSLVQMTFQATDAQGNYFVVTAPTGPGVTIGQLAGVNATFNVRPI